ncbi:MAG: hypothetical protein AB7E95_10830 [Kiritimatiellales bacterium]
MTEKRRKKKSLIEKRMQMRMILRNLGLAMIGLLFVGCTTPKTVRYRREHPSAAGTPDPVEEVNSQNRVSAFSRLEELKKLNGKSLITQEKFEQKKSQSYRNSKSYRTC